MGNTRKPRSRPTYGPASWLLAAAQHDEAERQARDMLAPLSHEDTVRMVAHLLVLSSALGCRWTDAEREAVARDVRTATEARRKIESR